MNFDTYVVVAVAAFLSAFAAAAAAAFVVDVALFVAAAAAADAFVAVAYCNCVDYVALKHIVASYVAAVADAAAYYVTVFAVVNFCSYYYDSCYNLHSFFAAVAALVDVVVVAVCDRHLLQPFCC